MSLSRLPVKGSPDHPTHCTPGLFFPTCALASRPLHKDPLGQGWHGALSEGRASTVPWCWSLTPGPRVPGRALFQRP